MKKYIVYIGILLVGLFIGWLIFSPSSQEQEEVTHSHNAEDSQMWTCAMHPQIVRPEPGDCPICGMALTPMETEEGEMEAQEFKMTENAMALANIQTTIVGTDSIGGNAITLSGKIQPNEDQVFTQPAHYNGRIEKLYIKSVGETVRKGQALAMVYSPELVSAQQELLITYKNRESQPQLYEAVRNKFKNWVIHDKEIEEVISSGKVKTRFTIHSHISGVVSSIDVTEGSHIYMGGAIFKTANLNSVWAIFDAYEKQISILKEGQQIRITTNAYPDKTISGTIAYIDPVMNTQTRTVEVRVVLNNKNGLFKPGMFVAGEIDIDKKDKAESMISIPASAIMWTGKRSVVYVKKPGDIPIFEMREVEIGNTNGNSYQVLNGLENGEEIVTNGTFTVDAAAQLQGKASMMTEADE
ncbi:efflux RND transporter periplasmic adaptor subunit [Galbibacter sp. EGI 63066]|uniref:efflux RND transporter periplasmic adaptor subunit n=1 Tax=Galbibacter sp. EGI 63066 TaxID=2993559 RepID=UPI002248D5E3|nr:efflux RND transporter periplasmic adaptor subunit [Galbibacter sp. EGI 63066]MCX2679142.1 efflux RND transporter periplasmic adaptor subunit [Galbibacter sp. EGI 63066]